MLCTKLNLFGPLRSACGVGMFAFLLLVVGFRPCSSFGQTPKFFEDLVFSDDVIHDFVAIAKTEGLFANHCKKFGVPLAIKKSSLQSRLQQISTAADEYQKRLNILEREQQKLQAFFLATVESMRAKSLAIPASRAAAEQLMIAAQLELQRVSWDLAAEMALLENEEAARDVVKSEEVKMEEELLRIESEKLRSELARSEEELELSTKLKRDGAISQVEMLEVRNKFDHVKAAFLQHEARVNLAIAKKRSAENAFRAESKQQVLKLTAKKKQIEQFIGEVLEAMPSIMQNESLSALATRHEASMASLSKLADEMETKKQEIMGLLSIIDSVKLDEKAGQEEKKD